MKKTKQNINGGDSLIDIFL